MTKTVINNDLVYKLIAQIPRGSVVTYKSLAEACGSKAYRAIGTIVGKNKNIPTIPCHRVVKSSGEIGNYVNGIAKKIALLNAEGVFVDGNKIINFDKKLFKF